MRPPPLPTPANLKALLDAKASIPQLEAALRSLQSQAAGTFDPMEVALRRIISTMKAQETRSAINRSYDELLGKDYSRTIKRGLDAFQHVEQRIRPKKMTEASFAGEMAGDIAGITSSMMTGDVNGAVKKGFDTVLKTVEMPFKLMAQNTKEAADRMAQLTGSLSAFGEYLEKDVQQMERIPLIGEHLAASSRAQMKMTELNLGFMRKIDPVFGELTDQLNNDIQALRANQKDAQKVFDANANYRMALGSIRERHDDVLEKQRDEGSWYNPFGAGTKIGNKFVEDIGSKFSDDMKSKSDQLEKHRVLSEIQSGKLTGTEMEERWKKAFGYSLDRNAGIGAAAQPAKFSSFQAYERELQQKAFSSGVDPAERSAITLNKIYDWLKERNFGVPGRSGPTMDDFADLLRNAVPGWGR